MNSITAILSDYTFRVVALGALLMGAISGLMGSFAVLKKQSCWGTACPTRRCPGWCWPFC